MLIAVIIIQQKKITTETFYSISYIQCRKPKNISFIVVHSEIDMEYISFIRTYCQFWIEYQWDISWNWCSSPDLFHRYIIILWTNQPEIWIHSKKIISWIFSRKFFSRLLISLQLHRGLWLLYIAIS